MICPEGQRRAHGGHVSDSMNTQLMRRPNSLYKIYHDTSDQFSRARAEDHDPIVSARTAPFTQQIAYECCASLYGPGISRPTSIC